jgi:hypothetical protein
MLFLTSDDDWKEELKIFSKKVTYMGCDPYPNYRKVSIKIFFGRIRLENFCFIGCVETEIGSIHEAQEENRPSSKL